MIVHFKETGHKIDDSKQVLVIYSPPDKVYYANSERDYYNRISKLEVWSVSVSNIEDLFP